MGVINEAFVLTDNFSSTFKTFEAAGNRTLNQIVTLDKCRLPRYLTKPRQRRSEWDMAGSDGISRVSAVLEENRY